MISLTFGEQVKVILSRKGMTIKQLAELVEEHTGKPMSRQNMTQRLGRDNFQEQDMRMIAEILGCKFSLSIIAEEEDDSSEDTKETAPNTDDAEAKAKERELLKKGVSGYYSKKDGLEVKSKATEKKADDKEQEIVGDINPYTRKEYKTNSVRMHPKRIGYVQVYNQEQHKWTDMTEWAFLGYQEREKALLGKNYVPPTYLD